MSDKLITQAEFARQQGVSRMAVNNAVKNGNNVKGLDIRDAIVIDGGVSKIDTTKLRKAPPREKKAKHNPAPHYIPIPPPVSTLPFGISESTLATIVPATISGVTAITSNLNLRADLKRPIMATLAGLSFAIVGRMAASDANRAIYTLLGGLLGSSIYLMADHLQHRQRAELKFKTSLDDVQKNNFADEDTAILGRNQSASALAGNQASDEKSSGASLSQEVQEPNFKIHPLPLKSASNAP
jgi:hypothetical protein